MPKSYSHLWERVIDFENLYHAYRTACKGKRYRWESLRFKRNLEENLVVLQNELIWNTYKPEPYRQFYVSEPKRRLISAPSFRDRVVHHALVQILEPVFENRFVAETFACRRGLGTHAAMKHVAKRARLARRRWGTYFVLKCDVHKFFPSVNHGVLKDIVRRNQHRQARVIYENPDMFDRVKRAWAIWVLANGSYGCKLNGGFGYDRIGTVSKKLANKRANFSVDYAIRLQRVQIECCDALKIIRSRDRQDAFFYLDPPYVGADQGHYDGYTQEDFDTLLELLEEIKGKFLLSSFHNKSLASISGRNGWYTVELKMASPMTHGFKSKREKIEVLTTNYPISGKLDERSKKQLASGEEEAGD